MNMRPVVFGCITAAAVALAVGAHQPALAAPHPNQSAISSTSTRAPDAGCDPGQDDRKSDLCAQWKAADAATAGVSWAKWHFILGCIGAAIGAGTLIAAWRAALYARSAASEAKRAADSSDLMATEARRSAEAAVTAAQSNRAWLLPLAVDQGSFTGTLDQQAVRDGLHFAPKIINSGGSPALAVSVRREFQIMAPGSKPTFQTEAFAEPMGLVAPNGTLHTQYILLNDEQTAAFRRGETEIAIHVRLRYRDIYGAEHRTVYTYIAVHTGGHRQEHDGVPMEAIGFTLIGEGQVAD